MDKEVTYDRFYTIMKEYNYRDNTIKDLWNTVKGTGATEERIRSTAEAMRPALELIRRANSGDKQAQEKINHDIKEMTKPIGKEGFFRECSRMGMPEESAKGLWEDHSDISEKDLRLILIKMRNDPELGPAMQILAALNEYGNLGRKKETVKKDLKKEEKWFLPTDSQKN